MTDKTTGASMKQIQQAVRTLVKELRDVGIDARYGGELKVNSLVEKLPTPPTPEPKKMGRPKGTTPPRVEATLRLPPEVAAWVKSNRSLVASILEDAFAKSEEN